MSERIEYLDSAKGVAMLLVIVGHCYWLDVFPNIRAIIYSFHMPLFFILSGMFVKPLGLADNLRKYSKAYLWPYLVTGLLLLLFWNVREWGVGGDVETMIKDRIVRILWGSGMAQGTEMFAKLPSIGPIWFLLALFWATSIYSFLKKTCSGLTQFLVIMLLAIVSIESIRYIRLPLSMQAGMLAVTYLAIGNMIREKDTIRRLDEVNWAVKLICAALFFVILVVMPRNGWFNISTVNLGWSIVGLWCSVVGSLTLIYLCYRTKLKTGWIGKNTLSILCAHCIILSGVTKIIEPKTWEYGLLCNFGLEITFEIVTAVILALCIKKIVIIK